ncbi:DUF5906 domain-containing protein [Klebsiella quasipneumoniae]|uniref:DUF5906 domain-containing protein n=1 Tax=Klebsiella quasipneumoniae TaxID=1463165 RepID=UPI0039836EC9
MNMMTHRMETIERARSALNYIDPSCDRGQWVKVGQAIHSEWPDDGGLALWDEWSKPASNYRSEKDTRSVWRGFKQGGGVTIAALYGIARDAGWRDNGDYPEAPILTPEEIERRRAERERLEQEAKAEEDRKHAAAAKRANEILASAVGNAAGHAYFEKKGGISFGNVKRGTWEQNGWDDALLVPIYTATQQIVGIEAISPDGEKRGLSGCQRKDVLFPLKSFKSSNVVLVAEGVSTAAAGMDASAYPAVCAFGKSNLVGAAKIVKKVNPGATVIVLADIGAEKHAHDAAAAVDGLWCAPEGLASGNDFWDLWKQEGADAVGRQIVACLKAGVRKELPQTQEPQPQADNDNAASQSDDDAEVPEHIRAIREINKNHALALTGDKALILRETVGERFGKELQYLSVATLRTWLLNRTVPMEVIGKGGQAAIKHVPVAELWLKSAERRQYEGVTFAPANNAPDCYYNLWSGFAYEPLDCGIFNAGMKCRRLLKHMKYILCGGNSAHFRYLLAWAADMLQDPDNKKGVALVMRGLKGTGKSTFAEALASLLGRHSIKIAHMRHLTGNFNRHLADKLLVLAEESYWAGDKADEGPLKDMITSDRMTIEAKGVDAVEMPSLCRLIMITNNEWAAPATADERRYFVLDVSDRRRQDYCYFDRLYGQLEGNDSEGYRALLSLLLQFPLKSVNLRQVPETTALRQQRALSLEPHDQFIYDALIDGTLAGKDWDGFLNVGKDELYDRYIESSRKRGKTHLLTKALFGKKFMAATAATTARIRDGYERLQVYRILPREETAIHFSQHCGVDVFIDGEYNERPI